MSATALLLTDGRFPSGGHAHSGGIEAAVAAGDVVDEATLANFLIGRLCTVGLVEAAVAAATVVRLVALDDGVPMTWDELDDECTARIASPVLRATSRRLGRQLVRAAQRIWPEQPHLRALEAAAPGGAHHAVVFGATAHAAGLDAAQAATGSAYACIAGPANAAVRLLGLDPFAVTAVLSAATRLVDEVASEAAAAAGDALAALPAATAPLLDVLAERHATWEVRLFAS